MASMTVEGRTDAQVFVTDVQTILVPTWPAAPVVLMENLAAPHVSGVKDAMASVGARLDDLPPDSHD